MVLRKWESRSSPPKESKARANARALFVISRRLGLYGASAASVVLIVIIVIIDTIDAIDIIDAIKYHLAVHGLKANYPTNSPIKSRLQRFFSLRNEIIFFIMLLLEKVITFATDHSPLRGLDPTFGQS